MTLERNLLSKALIQTNPKLTGNIKITVDSSNKIWLNSIDANDSLSQTRFKRFPIRANENYPSALNRFLLDGKFPTDILYEINQENNPTNLKKSLDEQYHQFYSAGAGALVDKNYDEDFFCFAPIYIKEILPTHFVIFKVPGAYTKNNNIASADLVVGTQYRVSPVSSTWTFSYNNSSYDNVSYPTGFTFTSIEHLNYTFTGEITVSEIGDVDNFDFAENPKNFNEAYLKGAKIVKTFDLKNSAIGTFLNNCVSDPQYPSAPLEVNFEQDKLSYWRGASYKSAVYASKGENLNSFYSTEKTIKSHDEYITLGFERNSLIYPHIFNLEFLFNDSEDENWRFNRYFGMYVIENEVGKFLLNGDNYYRFTDFNEQTPKLLKPKSFGYYWMTRPGNVKNSTGIELYVNPLETTSTINDIIKDDVLKGESIFTIKGRSGNFHRVKERELNPEFQKIKIFTENLEISDLTGFQYDKPIEVSAELLGPNGKAAFAFKIKPARIQYAFPKPNGGYIYSYQTGIEYGSIIQVDWLNTNLPLKINDVSEIQMGLIVEPLRQMDPENRILKFPDNIIETRIMGYHMYSDQIGNPQILLDPVVNPGTSYDIAFCQWAQDLPAQEKTAASIIAESICSALNALPDKSFTAMNINDIIYIIMNETGHFYNGAKFSTTLDSSRYELVKNQNYFGGGSNSVKRVKVSINDLPVINVQDWVKTKEGYSQIQSISPYVEEPIYNSDEDVVGYTDIDKFVVVTILDGTPVMVDKKIQIFRPLENKISLLSFLDVMDFDGSFNVSIYNRSLSYESKRYQSFDNISSTEINQVELKVLSLENHEDEPVPMKWMGNLNDNWFETLDMSTVQTTNPEIYDSFKKLDCLNTSDSTAVARIPVIDKMTYNPSVNGPLINSYLNILNPTYIFPFELMNAKWYGKGSEDIYLSTFASRINMPLLTSAITDDFVINSNLKVEDSDTLTVYKINSNVKNLSLTKKNSNGTQFIFNATDTEITSYDSDFSTSVNKQIDFESQILKNFLWKLHYVYHQEFPQFSKFRYYIIRYNYDIDSYYIILDPNLSGEFILEGEGLETFNTPICISNSIFTLTKYDDWTLFLKSEYETDPETILTNPEVETLTAYKASNLPVSLTTNETVDFIGFNHLNNQLTSDQLIAEKQNEYDRLNENYLKEFNYVSQVVPYINKWVFQGSKDVRSNPYRLNASLSFGKLNFSPSYNNFESNPEFFTHEWPYLAEYPIGYPDESLSKAFNYVGIGTSFDEFKLNMLDESTDWFITYFSKKNNKTIRTFPEDMFSKVVWTAEGGAVTVFKGVKLKFNERLEDKKLIFDSNVPIITNSNKYEDYKFTAVLFLKEKSSQFSEKSAVDHEFIVNDIHKHITFAIKASIEDYKLNPMQFNVKNSIDYFNLYNLKSQKKINRRELIYDDVILNGSLILNSNLLEYRYVEPSFIDKDGIHHFINGNLTELLNYNRNLTYVPSGYVETTDNNPSDPSYILASRLLDRSNLIIEFERSNSLKNAIMLGYRQNESETLGTVNPTWRYFDSKLWYLPSNGDSYPLFTFPDTFTDGTVSINEDIIIIEDNNIGDNSIQKIFLNTITGEYIVLTYSSGDFYQSIIGDTLPQIADYGQLNHFLVYPNGGYQFNKSIIDQLSFASINDLILKNNPSISYSFSNNSSRKIWIQSETPDTLNLTSVVTTSEDPIKPNELTLEPVVGYVTSNVEEKQELLRYSGSYEILLKNVVTFDEKENDSIIYSNVKFDVDVPGFGKYEKWFYKVSDNANILRSTSYPLIDEYAIDRKDEYVFKSQWDQEFFRKYSDKKTYNDLRGSRTMTDIQMPLTSKSVKVLKNIRVETFGFSSISSTQTDTQLIIIVDLNDSLVRYIADQLRSEFNKWVNIETGEFDSRDNEENLTKYVQKNLLKLYKLNTSELWQLKGADQNGLVVNFNDSQKQANGFVRQTRFASSVLDNKLTITIQLNEVKTLYAVTVSFTRI